MILTAAFEVKVDSRVHGSELAALDWHLSGAHLHEVSRDAFGLAIDFEGIRVESLHERVDRFADAIGGQLWIKSCELGQQGDFLVDDLL